MKLTLYTNKKKPFKIFLALNKYPVGKYELHCYIK